MRFVKGLVPLTLDWETFYDSKAGYTLRRMSMVSYVRDARFKAHGFAFSMPGQPARWVTAADIEAGLRTFDWAHIALIGHNLKFDGLILKEKYGIEPALFVDTLAISNAVHGATLPSHSLAALAEHYGLEEKVEMIVDGIRDLEPFQEQNISERALHDVELTTEIYERMRDQFPEGEYDMVDWATRCFVCPQLELDVPMLQETAKDEAARREAFFVSPLALEAAEAARPEPVLLKSGKPRKQKPVEPKKAFASNDMFPAVLKHFGYDTPMKNSPTAEKKGETKLIPALALGDPEFVAMLESDDAQLKALCEARVAAKSTLMETRSGKLAAVGASGVWPFDVVFSGAKQTHRFSGGPGAGGNPQNFPKCKDPVAHAAGHDCPSRIRAAVRAPAGYKLVVGDYANVELRVLAFLAQDRTLMDAIKQGRDLYCDFGTQFYGRIITKKDVAERQFAKIAVLGLGYGMGAEKFVKHAKIQADVVITEEEAQRAVDLYRSTYGGVPALWAYLGNLLPFMAAGQRGKLFSLPAVSWGPGGFRLPSNLEVRYPLLQQREVERKGKTRPTWGYVAYRQKRKEPDFVPLWGGLMTENLCQALAGELLKGALRGLDSSLWDAYTVGQVHDEILAVASAHEAEGYKGWMESALSTSPAWWPEIKLGAEVKIGDNWQQAH